jgi:hypothetical protein
MEEVPGFIAGDDTEGFSGQKKKPDRFLIRSGFIALPQASCLRTIVFFRDFFAAIRRQHGRHHEYTRDQPDFQSLDKKYQNAYSAPANQLRSGDG